MSDGFQKPPSFLLFPILLLGAFFLFDKVMCLDSVKRYTQDDATYIYYDYKPELLKELQEFDRLRRLPPANANGECMDATEGPCSIHSGKRILVVLGSSRLLYFDYANFKQAYPNWEMFNFSAPVSSPAYFDYMIQEILATGVVPDYALVESDPFQFNENSPGFLKSNLAYSFDLEYVLSNFSIFGQGSLFSPDEVSQFLGRTLFAGYRFPPNLDLAMKRLRNREDKFLLAIDQMDAYQRANRGAGMSLIPREDYYDRDYANLAVTSAMTIRWIYGNYELSERQWSFLDNLLARSRENGMPVVFLRPPVSRPMQDTLDEDEVIRENTAIWKQRMEDRLDSELLIDFTDGDPFHCNTFFDGSHMSLDCYNPTLRAAMDVFPLIRKRMKGDE
jgi:hypothetical protein